MVRGSCDQRKSYRHRQTISAIPPRIAPDVPHPARCWTAIGFNRGRIDSSKTGLRFCPLFPEVREVLLEAKEEAEGRNALVVRRFRGRLNLRTHFQRIVTGAGLKPWPKLFHNLRSSCRTELQERFPAHVFDVWLGRSTKMAGKITCK
jgi:hypothetical protein